MRTLVLLGKQDPGTSKSYAILCALSFLLVAAFNLPLLLGASAVARIVSNDLEVQHWFERLIWVLVLHSQTRVMSLNALATFIPMGMTVASVMITFVSFYIIAAPFASVVALTNLVTEDMYWKLVACVGATSIAQVVITVVGWTKLCYTDWQKAGSLINDRANTDKHDEQMEIDSQDTGFIYRPFTNNDLQSPLNFGSGNEISPIPIRTSSTGFISESPFIFTSRSDMMSSSPCRSGSVTPPRRQRTMSLNRNDS